MVDSDLSERHLACEMDSSTVSVKRDQVGVVDTMAASTPIACSVKSAQTVCCVNEDSIFMSDVECRVATRNKRKKQAFGKSCLQLAEWAIKLEID